MQKLLLVKLFKLELITAVHRQALEQIEHLQDPGSREPQAASTLIFISRSNLMSSKMKMSVKILGEKTKTCIKHGIHVDEKRLQLGVFPPDQ